MFITDSEKLSEKIEKILKKGAKDKESVCVVKFNGGSASVVTKGVNEMISTKAALISIKEGEKRIVYGHVCGKEIAINSFDTVMTPSIAYLFIECKDESAKVAFIDSDKKWGIELGRKKELLPGESVMIYFETANQTVLVFDEYSDVCPEPTMLVTENKKTRLFARKLAYSHASIKASMLESEKQEG